MTPEPNSAELTPEQIELDEWMDFQETIKLSGLSHDVLRSCIEGLNLHEPAVIGTPAQKARADALYEKWFAKLRALSNRA